MSKAEAAHQLKLKCSEPLSYFRNFLADVRDRTQTAMKQSHVFTVTGLALEAQAKSARAMPPDRTPG